MNTSALILMLFTICGVSSVTVCFLIKVLRSKPQQNYESGFEPEKNKAGTKKH